LSWEEFDLDRAVWTIPATRMKAGREHRIPLSRRALKIVKVMHETRNGNLVFPGQKPGKTLSVMALGMVVTAVAIGPVAAAFGVAGLAVALMLIAVAAGPVDVGLLTLRQRRTDPAELGRVLSVSMSLNLAGMPLGSALAGMLIGWSLPATFAFAALASLLAAASVALVPRQDQSG